MKQKPKRKAKAHITRSIFSDIGKLPESNVPEEKTQPVVANYGGTIQYIDNNCLIITLKGNKV